MLLLPCGLYTFFTMAIVHPTYHRMRFAQCIVFFHVGSNHCNPTEAWSASTQASSAAVHARSTPGYAASPHGQSLILSSSANAATTYPMMNGSVIPSLQQQPPHSVHFQSSQASSQLQYSFPQGAVLNPMAAIAANQYYLQTQGRVSYASPALYPKNAGTAPASYSIASHS